MQKDFSVIVSDNEGAVRAAFDGGDYVLAFLLMHSLVESLLRVFLRTPDSKKVTFDALIQQYKAMLDEECPGIPTFVDELTQFNRRRNRIAHRLWSKGYTQTNRQAEDAAKSAVIMYGLLIEFLQTFDSEIEGKGFRLNDETVP